MLQINFQLFLWLCHFWLHRRNVFQSLNNQNSISDQKQLYVDAAEISCCPVFRSTCYRSGGDSQYAQIFIIKKKTRPQNCIIANTCFPCHMPCYGAYWGLNLKLKLTDSFMTFPIFLWCRNLCPVFWGIIIEFNVRNVWKYSYEMGGVEKGMKN